MSYLRRKSSLALLGAIVLLLNVFHFGCKSKSSTLTFDSSSTEKLDTIFPNTPPGAIVKSHIKAASGNGTTAEAYYQKSLSMLRAEPTAPEVLYNTYRKVPAQNFFLRTMLVESLKELRSPNALIYLDSIANEVIPADLHPENTEINTQEDEIVIRITAVEGISNLAEDSLAAAEELLMELTNHQDLTVRQMATRGYLHSAFGNVPDKINILKRKLPQEEHWYITMDTTAIKKVQHPQMPAEFKLEPKNSSKAPTIKD
jgi:hypothetical protein